jgi:hypothetical protein
MEHSKEYYKFLDRRFSTIRDKVSKEDVSKFLFIEETMNASSFKDGWLDSFHLTSDYMKILEKILKALMVIGEPGAEDKYLIFLEEVGTMAPAVFLTPWEVTLFHLDSTVGNFDEVVEFYNYDWRE